MLGMSMLILHTWTCRSLAHSDAPLIPGCMMEVADMRPRNTANLRKLCKILVCNRRFTTLQDNDQHRKIQNRTSSRSGQSPRASPIFKVIWSHGRVEVYWLVTLGRNFQKINRSIHMHASRVFLGFVPGGGAMVVLRYRQST